MLTRLFNLPSSAQMLHVEAQLTAITQRLTNIENFQEEVTRRLAILDRNIDSVSDAVGEVKTMLSDMGKDQTEAFSDVIDILEKDMTTLYDQYTVSGQAIEQILQRVSVLPSQEEVAKMDEETNQIREHLNGLIAEMEAMTGDAYPAEEREVLAHAPVPVQKGSIKLTSTEIAQLVSEILQQPVTYQKVNALLKNHQHLRAGLDEEGKTLYTDAAYDLVLAEIGKAA